MLLLFNNLLEKFGRDLHVFGVVEFRAVLALLMAFSVVMLIGPRVIRFLALKKIGDVPDFAHGTINELMKHKKNTPTMGGLIIMVAIVAATIFCGDLSRAHGFYVYMGLICMVALAIIGGMDDWLKLTAASRPEKSRDGLRTWEKAILLFGLAAVISYFVYTHPMGKFHTGNPFTRCD